MLYCRWAAVVAKAARQTREQADALINFAQQQPATIGGQVTAIELCRYPAAAKSPELELLLITLCHHGQAALRVLRLCRYSFRLPLGGRLI